jgi:hypothetical protein
MLILDPITGTNVVVSPSLRSGLVSQQECILRQSVVTDRLEVRATHDAHSDSWSEHKRTEKNTAIHVYGHCLRYTRPRPRNVAS